MDKTLLGYIKKTNVNFLVVNTVFLLLLCYLIYIIAPFVYNAYCGPFPITWEEIFALSEDEQFINSSLTSPRLKQGSKFTSNPFRLPYFKRGNQFYFKLEIGEQLQFSELTWHEYYKINHWDLRKEGLFRDVNSKTFYANRYNEKILLGYDSVDYGIFVPMNKKDLESINGLQTILKSNNPNSKYQLGYKLQSGDALNLYLYQGNGFVFYVQTFSAILALLLVWCIMNFIIILRRFINLFANPAFKHVGDLKGMFEELKSDTAKVEGKMIYTENWVFERKLFTVTSSPKGHKFGI